MGRDTGIRVQAQLRPHSKKLVRAAAAAGKDDKKEPPPLLTHYWRCQKWGTLPKAGGMNDQDYRTMYLMNLLSRVFDASFAWNRKPKEMTPDQKKVMLWLIEMGVT